MRFAAVDRDGAGGGRALRARVRVRADEGFIEVISASVAFPVTTCDPHEKRFFFSAFLAIGFFSISQKRVKRFIRSSSVVPEHSLVVVVRVRGEPPPGSELGTLLVARRGQTLQAPQDHV